MVVSQSSFSSAKLKDPATGEMVDFGADIPMEQLLAGPRRGALRFETDDSGRSVGQMIAGKGVTDLPPQVKATGWKHGRSKTWITLAKGQIVAYRPDSSRELAVGVVHYNDKEKMSVELHSCRSVWSGMSVKHVKEYRRFWRKYLW